MKTNFSTPPINGAHPRGTHPSSTRAFRAFSRSLAAGAALAVLVVAGLGSITALAELPAEAISIGGADSLVGNYNGFFKQTDPAIPANPCTLDISGPKNRRFTATLTITFGADAPIVPIAFIGEGTVSPSGNVSIIAKAGLDMINVTVDAATFTGGAVTLDGTGKLHRRNAPDLDGTFIMLRAFDFDSQNPPPSLDGLVYRGRRIGDDGSSGPVTVQLSQSSDSNSLTGQGAFGLSSPPPDAIAALDAEDPPLTWSVLGTVSNAGDVVWIAQTAEHRLKTILHFPLLSEPGFHLFGSYTLHSFTAQTGALEGCACPWILVNIGHISECFGCPKEKQTQ
jgi:hypothetical protein